MLLGASVCAAEPLELTTMIYSSQLRTHYTYRSDVWAPINEFTSVGEHFKRIQYYAACELASTFLT